MLSGRFSLVPSRVATLMSHLDAAVPRLGLATYLSSNPTPSCATIDGACVCMASAR
jgi:hypothetical protein